MDLNKIQAGVRLLASQLPEDIKLHEIDGMILFKDLIGGYRVILYKAHNEEDITYYCISFSRADLIIDPWTTINNRFTQAVKYFESLSVKYLESL